MLGKVLSQRAVQPTITRVATASILTSKSMRLAPYSAIVMRQIRQSATAPEPSSKAKTVSQQQGRAILAAQRLNRPVSPHLSIYRPQITWYGSISHRLTGLILSGTLYIYSLGYLIAPYAGFHWESASIATAFAALPLVAQVLFKFLLVLPFSYHSLNGIRHLVWDTGAAFTKKQVAVTGWSTVAASTVVAFLILVLC